jgi:hypothetical protein
MVQGAQGENWRLGDFPFLNPHKVKERTKMQLLFIVLTLSLFVNAEKDLSLLSNQYFDIYYPTPRKELAEDISQYSLEELERIVRNLHITSVEKTSIYILEEEEFQKEYGEYLPEWGIGFAIPSKNLIILRFPTTFVRPSRIQYIVGHEIAHILIHKTADSWIPRWFDEGCAIHLSREPGFIDEIQLSFAVLFQRLIPLSEIEHTYPHSRQKVRFAYLESASSIHYLILEHGPNIIMDILTETRKEKDFKKGFQASTGTDILVFEWEWRKWLKRRYSFMFLLNTNILFIVAAVFVILMGVRQKLVRKRLYRIDEGFED